MSSFEKKIRDEEDKRKIKQITGKTPKHRCPVCHRYSIWITNKEVKNQCLMCKIIAKEKGGE